MTATLTHAERIAALKKFDYDPQEAQFLCIAALHSGYFLRRQFLAFRRRSRGWRDSALIEKLKGNRHCRTTMYRENRIVYHLAAKPLYDALGERDNRNRRERQPSTIKNKIMGLDFVLDHPQHDYLATEREKLDYFAGKLKIPPEDLPTRWYQSPRGRGATAKYFVDKFPMFLSVPPGGTMPVVHFCYVDEGLQSTDGFATYLSQYSRLFAALPDFRVVYIAQHQELSGSARRVFDALSAQLTGSTGAPMDPEVRQLLEHFETCRQYEARDFSRFDTARLIRYREDKARFSGPRFEGLYERWRAGGAGAVLEILRSGPALKELPVDTFSTCVLEYDYDLFGTLTTGRENASDRTPLRTYSS
jgi:hypothetical protein